MNLLEQYIKEIHSVTPYEEDWTKEFPDRKFLEVDVTTNCYGSLRRSKEIFSTTEWEKYKSQGYWMA